MSSRYCKGTNAENVLLAIPLSWQSTATLAWFIHSLRARGGEMMSFFQAL